MKLVDGKLAVKKDGGDVDALTAATISSRAYVDAINRAWMAYKERSDGRQRRPTYRRERLLRPEIRQRNKPTGRRLRKEGKMNKLQHHI